MCSGVTSSDPAENNLVVSYTRIWPCSKPTIKRVSLYAKTIMLGLPKENEIARWGLKTSSSSSFAALNAARSSCSGENMIADENWSERRNRDG